MTTTSEIVVGVDDSPDSLEALRVAADEAAVHGASLRVIHVWHFPSTWGVPLTWPAGANPGVYVEERLKEEVQKLQAGRAAAGDRPVTMVIEVIQGDTETELRAAADGAMMLALGERRHRGPRAILGSISSALATNPPCPVLIVPTAESAAH
jgi:nucleotide-binding universal stress UspA family protein